MRMLVYEFKNIVRDKMTLILLLYPLMVIGLGSFVIPVLIDNYAGTTGGQETASLIVIIIFASVAPFVTSALLGFSLLDHRDENTLDTLRVTPLSLRGYVLFKTLYAYLLSVNASFWILFGTKVLSGDGYTFAGVNLWDSFSLGAILLFAFAAGFFTPVFALLLSSIAKNKIEGFAYMKTTGIFALLPALVVLENLQDFKQYFLGIFPTFWPVKGMLVQADLLSHDHNLPVILYMLIGVLYPLALSLLAYRVFEKKLEQ